MEHQTNTNTKVTVPLRDEFNRNKETEAWDKRANNLDQRMKHEISQYFLFDVCYASNLKGAEVIQSYVRLSISVA